VSDPFCPLRGDCAFPKGHAGPCTNNRGARLFSAPVGVRDALIEFLSGEVDPSFDAPRIADELLTRFAIQTKP
jgi:hypothetical protein